MIYVLVYYQACARTQFSGGNFDFGKCSVFFLVEIIGAIFLFLNQRNIGV